VPSTSEELLDLLKRSSLNEVSTEAIKLGLRERAGSIATRLV
jgi:hypothetical protein